MIRDRLLSVAVERFGDAGFEGASTRDIAQAADTAMSSITYHFGSKEGLYLACADYIAEMIRERQANARAILAESIEGLTPELARERLLAVLDGLAAMMLGPETESWSRFIVREQQSPTEAFERLYAGAMGPMIEGASRLLAIARPELDERERHAMIMLLFGQVLVLRVGRASLSRTLGVADLGETEGRLLRTQLRSNALAILTAEKAP
jgi:AcrR family transcriptional regulator